MAGNLNIMNKIGQKFTKGIAAAVGPSQALNPTPLGPTHSRKHYIAKNSDYQGHWEVLEGSETVES